VIHSLSFIEGREKGLSHDGEFANNCKNFANDVTPKIACQFVMAVSHEAGSSSMLNKIALTRHAPIGSITSIARLSHAELSL